MLHFCPSHYPFWWLDICGRSGLLVCCCCCKWPVKCCCCIGSGDAIPHCRQFNQLIGGDDGWLRHMITCNLLPGHASWNIIANGKLSEGQPVNEEHANLLPIIPSERCVIILCRTHSFRLLFHRRAHPQVLFKAAGTGKWIISRERGWADFPIHIQWNIWCPLSVVTSSAKVSTSLKYVFLDVSSQGVLVRRCWQIA